MIINSAYCRFLCLISLHTACVNSYTFSAAQIQVIIFDSYAYNSIHVDGS